jgi:hypothetical protein
MVTTALHGRVHPVLIGIALAAGCAPRPGVCTSDADCVEGAQCAAGTCVAALDDASPGGTPLERATGGEGERDVAEGEGEGDVGEGEGEGEAAEGEGEGDAFDNGFAVRIPVTVDGAAAPADDVLVAFPLLIEVRKPALRSLPDGVLTTGADVMFVLVDDNGETPLPAEIATHDDGTGLLRAWVRIPALAPGVDVELALYAGKAGATLASAPRDVWSDTYGAVLHLDDAPSAISDAAGAVDDVAVRNVADDARVAGRIGDGLKLTDDDDDIELWSDALNAASEITFEVWAQMTDEHSDPDAGFQRLMHKGWAERRHLELFIEDHSTGAFGDASFRAEFDTTGNWAYGPVDEFALFEWHHYVGVVDLAQQLACVYVDAIEIGCDAFAGPLEPEDVALFHVGNWDSRFTGALSRAFHGVVDEARIAPVALSEDWIETEYDNVVDPARYVIVGETQVP